LKKGEYKSERGIINAGEGRIASNQSLEKGGESPHHPSFYYQNEWGPQKKEAWIPRKIQTTGIRRGRSARSTAEVGMETGGEFG